MPPKEGLQEHTPRFDNDGVTKAVLAPDRAAAAHASVPAWPPPITTTSYGLAEGATEAKVRLCDGLDRTRGAWPQHGSRALTFDMTVDGIELPSRYQLENAGKWPLKRASTMRTRRHCLSASELD